MSTERERTRCTSCELVQWSDGSHCRRCGEALPEPIVNVVERVVEKVVIQRDPQCLEILARAASLIASASQRIAQQPETPAAPVVLGEVEAMDDFPTMAQMERAMVVAAYRRSDRRPLEAARLLGIGKTTLYRKLKEMGQIAA